MDQADQETSRKNVSDWLGYKQSVWVRLAWIHVSSMGQIGLDTSRHNGPVQDLNGYQQAKCVRFAWIQAGSMGRIRLDTSLVRLVLIQAGSMGQNIPDTSRQNVSDWPGYRQTVSMGQNI